MSMDITFPGGVAVDSHYRGFTVRTDQPPAHGGRASAPTPFDLLLAALGACAGFYALRFCQQRQLSTTGLALRLDFTRGDDGSIAEVRLELGLPAEFPEKYRAAILRAIDHCAVKRQLESPPRFHYQLAAAANAPAV